MYVINISQGPWPDIITLPPPLHVQELKIGTDNQNSNLHIGSFVIKLSTYVNIRSSGTHSTPSNETTFNQLVWIMSHDFAIFARPWFSFVCVDNKVFRSAIGRFIHETPFKTRWKSCK